MKKFISLMLAAAMMCTSFGLTVFAADKTTVEAEEVSAYTLPESDSNNNSKIIKNNVSDHASVTYYIQKDNIPRATMFKLAQVNTGDKVSAAINFTYLEQGTTMDYCLFVSDSEIALDSHSQDDVIAHIDAGDANHIKSWLIDKSSRSPVSYSLPEGITASKDGYVYLYIGCGDLNEDKTKVTRKTQWSIDSFDVTINGDGGDEPKPDVTPTPTPDSTATPAPASTPTSVPEQELTLDAVYSSNMVLQRGKPITITGTGKSGNTVEVKFNGAEEQTTIEHGLWEITLPAMDAVKSETMTVVSDKHTITLDNVAVGDVIFCTGQSNMFLNFNSFQRLKNEIDRDYDDIRFMTSFETVSEWQVATQNNSVSFSALGYLMGKRLLAANPDVPVGLISSSLGGSSIMQWIPAYSVNWDSQAKRMMAGASSKGGLYTQRFLPIKNLKAAAVVWYQGEANTTFESGTVYEQALTSLINNWRKTLNDEDLPFVIIQLPTANFAKIYGATRIGTGVRAGQWNVSQRMDNVKTVVSNDTGSTNNVHPQDKQLIADRAVAFIRDYINETNSQIESPSFDHMERDGDTLILHFKNTYGSLSTDDEGAPLGFELKGEDGAYNYVTPTIDGDTIKIDVSGITDPQVRYAWSDAPGIAKDIVDAQTETAAVINTFNAAGRPIAPFMTDSTEKYNYKVVDGALSASECYNTAPYISKVEQVGDDIVISAYDTDGIVSKVEVYIDEAKAGDAALRDDGKWVFTPDVAAGVHSVYAVATDNDNIVNTTCVDYPNYDITRQARYDYVKGYTEKQYSSVEYNNGDEILSKATVDADGTTKKATSEIPVGETTKSLRLAAAGSKTTASVTVPISEAQNAQKTLTIEYDTMFESGGDKPAAARGMYAKTKAGKELWLTYFTASSLRVAVTNTGGNWCYEQATLIVNHQWHHIKLELHPNTGTFSAWLDGTMLQDNVSFVKEGNYFETYKEAFDTLKEGITALRFYHQASNADENATYIDNIKVTEVSYIEDEITPEPTPEATETPMPEPTAAPTLEPTTEPTPEPTAAPTLEPTTEPTIEPTQEPTEAPATEAPEPTDAPEPETTYTVSGTITGGTATSVKLVPGDKTAEITDGKYEFTGVAPGMYNIVVTYDNGKTKTVFVEVNGDITDKDIDISSEGTADSKVEVNSENEDLKNVVVDGLDTAADEQDNKSIVMKVSDSNNDVAKSAIKELANTMNGIMDFIDITLMSGDDEEISTLGNALDIYIPFNGNVKAVYRYHDNKAEEMSLHSEGPEPDEWYEQTDKYIHIHAKKFSTYAALIDEDIPKDKLIAETATIKLEDYDNDHIWDIVLYPDKTADGEETYIRRYMSAELTFDMTLDGKKADPADYEIMAYGESSVTKLEGGKFGFNMNGEPYPDVSSTGGIIIGRAKIMAYGDYTLSITKGIVRTAENDNNIVHTYNSADTGEGAETLNVPNGNKEDGDADINPPAGGTKSPKQVDLNINVIFPNKVSDQVQDYMDMTININSTMPDSAKEIRLGKTNETGGVPSYAPEVKPAKFTYTYEDGITKADEGNIGGYLVNTKVEVPDGGAARYTISISGEGYRTYRKDIVVNSESEAVTVNIWNNYMDKPMITVDLTDGDPRNLTFLAGDIIEDGKINLYDLSAGVSYFGKEKLTENPTENSSFIRYDLNRDGVIDSRDVAMILVSWDK